jgi:hypothetical protein
VFSNVDAVTYQTALEGALRAAAENSEKWVKGSKFGASIEDLRPAIGTRKIGVRRISLIAFFR